MPTEQNAADGASRGQELVGLKSARPWVSGPELLREEEDQWPASDVRQHEVLANDPETKSVLVTIVHPELDPSAARPGLNCCSRWLVAVRTMAAIRRWLLRHRDGAAGEFTPCEMEHAERVWIKTVQHELFATELKDLKAGRAVRPKSKIALVYRPC